MSISSISIDETTDLSVQKYQEDNKAYMAISCIPIIGMFFSAAIKISLIIKIFHTQNATQIIELTNIKKKYLKIDICRELFPVVLSIIGIVTGIISVALVPVVGAHFMVIGLHLCIYCIDNQKIKQVNENKNNPSFFIK